MAHLLKTVFEGWEGYNTSLVHAIEPLSQSQLEFRLASGISSVGEIVEHLALGRLEWFSRMKSPGSVEMWEQLKPRLNERGVLADRAIATDASSLVRLLNETWAMVERSLNEWTVDDIWETYEQPYQGVTYAVSRQWVLWRIMCHDIQHGGQLTILLRVQGIEPEELSDLGGHITVPPVAG